jgi:hypothetical protein
MNAGFLLQQIDLYLSANSIGSCWLGMAKPSKEVPQQVDGLEFVIMLAFGNAAEQVHRAEPSEFRRKSISEISAADGLDEMLEPVRLAPSASNGQPWFFTGDEREIIVSRVRLNLIKAQLYGKMNQIDIGIALCHLQLSLDRRGMTAVFDPESAPAPNGYEFMMKVLVDGI